MDARYYKEYYTLEREHWWFVARGVILMGHIRSNFPNRKDLKILNVGAATGRSSELLAEFGTVTSVEFDDACRAFTQENTDLEILAGSILDLEFSDNSFDLVCAFDVIEHVEDDSLAVQEMKRVCKADGVVCVSVPAFKFLWSEHDEVNQHFRRYTKKSLEQVFQGTGKLIYSSYFNSLLFPLIAGYRLTIGKLFPPKKSDDSAGSDFSVAGGKGFVNKALTGIFLSESSWIRKGRSFPAGVSLLLSWKKAL